LPFERKKDDCDAELNSVKNYPLRESKTGSEFEIGLSKWVIHQNPFSLGGFL
jgi:hypothetical protein